MPAHLEDTLFLFFESDFRFWKEDCIAPELWLRLAVQSCREPLASITGVDVKEGEEEEGEPASSSTARASRLAGPDTLPQPQPRPDADSQGRFISMEAIWKPWQDGYQTVSTELVELVQCATRASRLAHGDLIWFGYNCGDEKQKGPNDKIAFGSQGIMFTMRAAKRLNRRMQGVTPQHFDLWLKEVLLEQSTEPSLSRATIRACYVVPPLGGFQTHNTGCRGDFGVRTGLWDEPWSSPGGMRDHRASRRWLARFSKSRNPAEYHLETLKFPVVTARHHWLTALPPRIRQAMARSRGSSQSGHFWGHWGSGWGPHTVSRSGPSGIAAEPLAGSVATRPQRWRGFGRARGTSTPTMKANASYVW